MRVEVHLSDRVTHAVSGKPERRRHRNGLVLLLLLLRRAIVQLLLLARKLVPLGWTCRAG